MSMVSGGPRNDNSYLPGVSNSRPRMEPKQKPQARPQMPKKEAKARLRDSRNIVPGGAGADTFLDGAMPFLRAPRDAAVRGMEAVMPFLKTPGRVARGAVEGGIQAINPDFEMPDYSNAQIPGVDFMNFITGSGVQDQGRRMPMQRNIDPGTDAILRAIMARMQGGQ